MRVNQKILISTVASLTIAVGCKRDEAPPADREAERQPADEPSEPGALLDPREVAEPSERPQQSVARTTAEQLRQEFTNYRDWPSHTDAPVRGEHPQGEYIQLFYNQPAKAAIGGTGDWPDEVIFVKDNYASNQAGDGPGELAAITVMKKGAGVWFWAQYKADGSLFERPDGSVVAGAADLPCIACHESAERRDHVITELRRPQ